MRLVMRLVLLAAVVAFMVLDFQDWIYVDQGPAYFAADWRRIALVVVLSLGGGLIAFLFMRLPAIVGQRVTTGVFGAGLLLATICCAYSAWALFKLRVFPAELKEQLMPSSIVLGTIALTAFVWFLFSKYWRRISGPIADA